MDRSDRPRPLLPLGAALGLVVALGATACNPRVTRHAPAAGSSSVGASDPAPAHPEPGTFPNADTIEGVLDNGWITVSVTLPRHPAGAKPVVISPIVEERELLERGIGFVKFRTHWEILQPFADAARAKAAADAAAATARADKAGAARALAIGTGAPASATGEAPGAAKPTVPAPPEGTAEGEASVGAWLLAAPRPGIVGRAYFGLITTDATGSIPRVIDFLATVPQVDPTRIAIGGSSTSGFVALQAMAAEPRIAAAVVRVACGDYLRFLRSSRLALNDDARWVGDGPLPLDPDYLAEIRLIEPIGRAARFPPRPLLLMVGDQDPAIPFACAERTAEVFGEAYRKAGAGDRFRFDVFSNEGHNLGGESQRRAIDWWARWLLGSQRRGEGFRRAARD